MKYVVRTLGCKANLADSQKIEADLRRLGWTSADDGSGEPEICVVNSCTVTNDAEKQSRAMARRLARQHPGARVVLTGCSAEVDPEALKAVTGVSYVVANRDKGRFAELMGSALREGAPVKGEVLGVARGYEEMRSRHPLDREWALPEELPFAASGLRSHTARTRAFLKIQEGCDSFCTFCVIPYGRGPSRSLPFGDVAGQIQRLVEQGVREVVLTGTNIGQYGMDWPGGRRTTDEGYGEFRLEELCRRILGETGLERLRVSSLDPIEITKGLTALMEADSRFCPHFHVSLQSPHSRILRLMKRKYGAGVVRECLERIASLKVGTEPFVGMDLITGFPGETQEIFEESMGLLESLPWTRLHVFPYSERKGTPATRLPGNVPPEERKRRARTLNALSLERLKARYGRALQGLRQGAGELERILLESPCKGPDGTEGWWGGYTPDYLRVLVKTPEAASNAVLSARPTSVTVDAAAGDCALF